MKETKRKKKDMYYKKMTNVEKTKVDSIDVSRVIYLQVFEYWFDF